MANSKLHNEKTYPGAAVDAADNEKDNACLRKQYTRDLNNNPRNQGQII